jgi:hypothetical protein
MTVYESRIVKIEKGLFSLNIKLLLMEFGMKLKIRSSRLNQRQKLGLERILNTTILDINS